MIDLLLFGKSQALNKKGGMTTSFDKSFLNSTMSMQQVSQVAPLRYLLKHAEILRFEIAVTNSDGTRRNEIIEEEPEAEDKGATKKKAKAKPKGPKSNQSKI